jgi:thiol-disulfide isomerase/thioredoxin
LVAALAGTALVGTALAGCSSSSGAQTVTEYPGGDGSIIVVKPAELAKQKPVELRGTTLEGAPIDVASLRGKVVVLNVWGSWCPPCRKEAPDLQAAYVALKPKGVEFLGIDSNDKDKAQALAFQKTFGITYPSLADDGGGALLALRGAVAPNAIPTTLVLDAKGRVAARISSATTKATLVGVVEDVIAGKSGA